MEIIEFKKNLVFKELHNYYVTNFGFDHGVVKYSNLLGLMHDLNVRFVCRKFSKVIIQELNNHLKETYTIGKIFDPTLLDVFDDAV